MITELEVLNLLDETMTFARGDIPPPPDIYNINFQFVEGMLSVFRNAHDWVIAFVIVAYVLPRAPMNTASTSMATAFRGKFSGYCASCPPASMCRNSGTSRQAPFWQGGIVFASSGATKNGAMFWLCYTRLPSLRSGGWFRGC